ncbi:type VI secretion lipoprotein TssJ [Yersinia mollaretii]|uniref:type VI secretion lipoprotein TssJ n=1 Tax=Yersinia mollaretii TaxID=33060 RepID=UPI0021BDD378|nr:type VI secretion lipoprotein TssJ [Yersinia mollaretii]
MKAFWPFAMLVFMLTGCSHQDPKQRQQAIDTVAQPFAKSAITIQLTAQPGLNTWNGLANSSSILVIQAGNAAALDKLLKNPVQLKSMFAGTGSEADILQLDRYVVMPGQQNTLHIDRAENTRYLALVASYFPFPDSRHIARFTIPMTLTAQGWPNKIWVAQLVPLNAYVTLGSESIVAQKHDQPTLKEVQ